ncbi:MAG: DNA-directed RNA polymerase subunit L [Thermoplasmata archaeon]
MLAGTASDDEELHPTPSPGGCESYIRVGPTADAIHRRWPGSATLKNRPKVARRPVHSMELRVVEKSNDLLRVELPRGEETLLIPLVEALQKEEKVVEARYYLGHPYLERPTLVLKTKGEKPQQVLKRVLKDLADLYGDLLTDFDKKADKVKA